ncbi:MAG: cupin domain-containing protein [Bacteroidia bacterium]
MNAEYYINKLGLTKHIEGGSFKETYRSKMLLPNNIIDSNFAGTRSISTAIYFLLEHNQFSAFHKIASDEMWHFYAGNTLTVYEIEPNGNLKKHLLGSNLDAGETFQCVIKAGNWFASRCEVINGFSLVGCTVAPGFDFEDFLLADRNELLALYPQHKQIITELTYS